MSHLAGGLASLFGTLWDYMENLYISNCAPVMRPDDLVHLACFSKLVRLNIDSLRGPVEARQINYLGRLTNLQELRILFAGHGLEQNLLVCVQCCSNAVSCFVAQRLNAECQLNSGAVQCQVVMQKSSGCSVAAVPELLL